MKVSCATCSGPHHKPMCSQLDVNKKPDFARESPVPPDSITTAVNANYACSKDVLLKTLLVRVKGPSGSEMK